MASASCYDKAVDLLARRGHFRRQLEEKLRSRGYQDEAIRDALDRLTEHGYLDDTRAARDFARARLRRGPLGRRRMRLELEKRGAAADAVDRVLGEVFADHDDLESARAAAERWRRRGRRDVAALARHLERLGFTTRSILRVVDEERAGGEDRVAP